MWMFSTYAGELLRIMRCNELVVNTVFVEPSVEHICSIARFPLSGQKSLFRLTLAAIDLQNHIGWNYL